MLPAKKSDHMHNAAAFKKLRRAMKKLQREALTLGLELNIGKCALLLPPEIDGTEYTSQKTASGEKDEEAGENSQEADTPSQAEGKEIEGGDQHEHEDEADTEIARQVRTKVMRRAQVNRPGRSARVSRSPTKASAWQAHQSEQTTSAKTLSKKK